MHFLTLSPVAIALHVLSVIAMTVGGFWGMLASEGHPAFLLPIAFGLFYLYLLRLIFFTDWITPKPSKGGNH